MDHMDLGPATSRTPVTIRMVWIVASLLFVLGSWLIGQGLWIHVKAVAAQWLLQNAWHETLKSQQADQALAMGRHVAGGSIDRPATRHQPDHPGGCQRTIISIWSWEGGKWNISRRQK